MVSRLNWNENGQRKWVCFWTDVCWTSRPQRDSGAAILQVSCKYTVYATSVQLLLRVLGNTPRLFERRLRAKIPQQTTAVATGGNSLSVQYK